MTRETTEGTVSLDLFVSEGAEPGEHAWVSCVSARLARAETTPEESGETTGDTPASLAEIRARCTEHVDGPDFYSGVAGSGFDYGTAFQGVAELDRQPGEALGLVRLDERLAASAGL